MMFAQLYLLNQATKNQAIEVGHHRVHWLALKGLQRQAAA